ncbi:MAG: TylF/MycF/NovP-related O-methyltransferase [Myxococcota bacterium]|nr:TylF/MycF/NovP-related O-methyltransferase [Myxococcota bacterium]
MRELDSKNDNDYFHQLDALLARASLTPRETVENFTRFASIPSLSRFLARYEIFKLVIDVPGVVIDAGVFHGFSLFTWAKLSSILEPVNHTRRIVGFDTFEGFTSLRAEDQSSVSDQMHEGGYQGSALEELRAAIEVFDVNRPLNHIDKIELVKGDVCETAPQYLEDNAHLVVSMLHLDVDLYEPTRVLIETFLPRMPQGSLIVFDELNSPFFPGETQAALDTIGLAGRTLRKLPFHPWISYIRL